MTYYSGKCLGNCSFCSQARLSGSRLELLSRVTWPAFPSNNVAAAIKTAFDGSRIRRVCIQALNYPGVFADLQALVKEIKRQSTIPISVSCQPLNKENILRLNDAGVDRLGIALDAATDAVFDAVKGKTAGGCYSWRRQFQLLGEALQVFGVGKVSTHVIVGLGETERETVEVLQRCVDMGVLPALFAFTPVRGTALEKHAPPVVEAYRRVQLARYLIVTGKSKASDMAFGEDGEILSLGAPDAALHATIQSGEPFQTSGCPNCNRPYYNEKPSGPIYNYPRKLNIKEIEKIKADLGY